MMVMATIARPTLEEKRGNYSDKDGWKTSTYLDKLCHMRPDQFQVQMAHTRADLPGQIWMRRHLDGYLIFNLLTKKNPKKLAALASAQHNLANKVGARA